MTPRVNATPSLAIIDALDSLTKQVQKVNADIPDNIVIVLASGKSGRANVHGHFAPGSWQNGHHEILISAESLARGPEATLGTLIHELAHAKANKLEIRDTSNNNRYHNKRFKKIAEEMGITLELAGTIGWSKTTLPSETAVLYSAGLIKLEKSLTTYRMGRAADVATAPAKPRKTTKAPMQCECFEPVTVSIQWFERMGSNLSCFECGSGFELLED